MVFSLIALTLGFILDLIIGDPHKMPHYVRAVGRLIERLEPPLRARYEARTGGVLLVLLTVLICGGIAAALIFISYSVHPVFGVAVEAVICFQTLAVKSLKQAATDVYRALRSGDIAKSRRELSMIVGRDTDTLDEAGITRAAVETVAENSSDGCIAPMIFLLLGGGTLGVMYKAVNTMDSMVGYKNERYIDFGRAAALLDDAVNFIPARFAALLSVIAARILRFDTQNAIRVWRRDRRNHPSPNSAQTESVYAGALGIRLAGPMSYFGKTVDKPYIGDDTRPAEGSDIARSCSLLYVSSALMAALAIALRLAAILLSGAAL